MAFMAAKRTHQGFQADALLKSIASSNCSLFCSGVRLIVEQIQLVSGIR